MTFSQKCQNSVWKIIIFFLLGGLLGIFWTYFLLKNDSILIDEPTKNSFSQNSQLFDNPKFHEIYNTIEKNFYGFETKSKEEIEENFYHSIVEALGDKHSEYFNAKEKEEFMESLDGNFEWIGAVLDESDEGIKIKKVLPNSPAEESGIMAGDIIVEVNNQNVVGFDTKEVVKLVRGERWTEVVLWILRDGEVQKISVRRDVINIPSVEGKILEEKIGYIQINTFGQHTAQELLFELERIKKEWIEGLILDFRFNTGWYLESAQELLSVFLPVHTKIVTTKETDSFRDRSLYTRMFSFSGGSGKNFLATMDTEIPMVVLVNEFSASASEVFAGAIQDYERGILVGTKTFGKGSVQKIFPLKDGSMMKITVAKWYTSKDKNIDEEGIDPDIVIDFEPEDYKNSFDRQLDVATKTLKELLKNSSKQEVIEFMNNQK